MRWEIPYTSNDKKRFMTELKQKLSAIKLAVAQNSFYKHENSCTGLYTCDYLEACASNSFANFEKTNDIFPELDKCEVRI